MKIYLVGGSVRDRLLNIPPRDSDYLVVDATPEELLNRGLVKIGQTFPIFLNPENGDEYTLGKTLEDDLSRRDLTINALALDESNQLIDPYGGESDLKNKILRHVRAENFYEDPLRVLRAARFRAQLPEFSLSPETEILMKEVTATEVFRNILPERIIKELKRVFECSKPSLFFHTLKNVKGMEPYFREIKTSCEKLDFVEGNEELSFSLLVSGMSLIELEEFSRRLNIQTNWWETASAWLQFEGLDLNSAELVLDFFYDVDAFRKPRMIDHVSSLDKIRGSEIQRYFQLVKDIGIKDVPSEKKGKEISEEIRRMRRKRLG